jgi:hypothetical protein
LGHRFFIRLYLFSLAVQWGVTLVAHVYSPRPVLPDSQSYDTVGKALASAWGTEGFRFDRLASLCGTTTWGTYVFFGVAYRWIGSNWLYPKLAIGLVAATTAVSIAALASRCGLPDRHARVVGIAVGLYPTALLWTAIGLKDSLVAAMAFGVLALQAVWPGLSGGIIIVAGSAVLLPFRPVMSGALLVSALLRSRQARDSTASRGLYLVAALVIGLILIVPSGQRLADGVSAAQTAGEAPVTGNARSSQPLAPAQLVRGAMGPFPWSWDDASATTFRWVYPGMVVWILLLPLAFLGGRQAAKTSPLARQLSAFVIIYLVAYYATFSAGFFRQRTAIEPIALLFAAIYAAARPRTIWPIVSTWVVIVAGFAIVQSRVVSPKVLVVVILALVPIGLIRGTWRLRTRRTISSTRTGEPHPIT